MADAMIVNEPDKKLFIPAPVPPQLLQAARALRGSMTDAEQFLWKCLRRKQLGGFRFRRQHPFDRFVLDYYCCEAKLAVELDGGQHNEENAKARDKERTELLSCHGITVIRFWNNDVFTNIEGVLQSIYDVLNECISRNVPTDGPLPGPPPLGEGI